MRVDVREDGLRGIEVAKLHLICSVGGIARDAVMAGVVDIKMSVVVDREVPRYQQLAIFHAGPHVTARITERNSKQLARRKPDRRVRRAGHKKQNERETKPSHESILNNNRWSSMRS